MPRSLPTSRPLTGLARWSGPAFVLLAMVSSAAVSLPLSSDPPARIAALYAEHRAAYTAAQAVGLLGVLALVVWVRTLRRNPETSGTAVQVTGWAVAAAALATNLTVLVLCLDAGLSLPGVHRAAVATDVADDALFLALGLMALAIARSGLPAWLRGPAAAAGLVSLVRALEPWLSVPGLEAAAALGVLSVLLVVGVRTARDSGRAGTAGRAAS